MSTISEKEKAYWIALAHCEALVPYLWKRLFQRFSTGEEIWNASQRTLESTGLPQRVAAELVATRQRISPEKAMETLAREQLSAITLQDDGYPRLLKEIHDPPWVLFVQGDCKKEESPGALGVVGTRKISSYGQTVLPPIVISLAQAEITIVSGLALGIDGLAHETTLQAHGRTIAVIGSGIDRQSIYPSRHRYLADRIVASGGAVVSEYPAGSPPLTHHFPARNRIISGLSRGVLVCEAPERSGALITTAHALDQNRDVFAIPGPITHPNSFGPHLLIKNGATPVTSADDILDAIHFSLPAERKQSPKKTATDNPTEQQLIGALHNGPLHIDALVRQTNLTIEDVTSTLVLMEMRGIVRTVGGAQYAIA